MFVFPPFLANVCSDALHGYIFTHRLYRVLTFSNLSEKFGNCLRRQTIVCYTNFGSDKTQQKRLFGQTRIINHEKASKQQN